MEFGLNDQQQDIVRAIESVCAPFDDAYWLERDREGGFPEAFVQAVADGGWLGIAMPESVGGAGLGITEAALMMHTIAKSGGGFSAASAVHMNIFGLKPIMVHGTEEQQQRMLVPVLKGEERACFAVTEPDAGLNTTALQTRADRTNDGYVINGKKVWTSTAQIADKMLILVRTTPREECERPADGMSLFYTKLDRDRVDVREIEKMGRKAVDSNEMFIDNLDVPFDDLIGEEGKGFKYIFDGFNPERILIAAECIGLGQLALSKAANYAGERVVFDRPIGQNQAIQHPLAQDWMALESAFLLVMKAAWLYDTGQSCAAEANAAKYMAAEAAYKACQNAVMTHGGFGYAKEFHVERYLRESLIGRIAPISAQLIQNFIAERVLGLPKSY